MIALWTCSKRSHTDRQEEEESKKRIALTELRSLSFSISTRSPMLTRSMLALWLVATARQEDRSTSGNTWQSSRYMALGHV